MNTDGQALALAEAPTRIQLGEKLTRGLGPAVTQGWGQSSGRKFDIVEEIVQGADMVFIAAGMGGGTGTGGIPVVAEIAKKSGALTIGVVTKPFALRGA